MRRANFASQNFKDMKKNIGAFDGWFRILLFMIGMIYAIMWGPWYVVLPGAILLATAILQWCPLYELVGYRTFTEEEV